MNRQISPVRIGFLVCSLGLLGFLTYQSINSIPEKVIEPDFELPEATAVVVPESGVIEVKTPDGYGLRLPLGAGEHRVSGRGEVERTAERREDTGTGEGAEVETLSMRMRRGDLKACAWNPVAGEATVIEGHRKLADFDFVYSSYPSSTSPGQQATQLVTISRNYCYEVTVTPSGAFEDLLGRLEYLQPPQPTVLN